VAERGRRGGGASLDAEAHEDRLHVARDVRAARKPATVKQVEIPEKKRFPPERLILRCLPSVASVTTTTTTTLPGTLNLTGDWTLATSETARGCPSDINNPMLSPRELLIMQTGTALSGCASNFLNLSGTASNGSFVFQPDEGGIGHARRDARRSRFGRARDGVALHRPAGRASTVTAPGRTRDRRCPTRRFFTP
jgi:hypothetical protein